MVCIMSYEPVPYSPTTTDETVGSVALKTENEIVMEIEFAIASIEKSLARWESESSNSPLKDTVLPITILSSIGYLGSSQPRTTNVIFPFEFPNFIFAIGILFVAAHGIFMTITRFRDRKIRFMIMHSQVDAATETLSFLRSWIDRADMSNRLRFLMQNRADYLEALVLQAKQVSKRRLDII